MSDGLGQMAAGGAVMRFVVTGNGRLVLFRLGRLLMSMVSAVAVIMMPSGLHRLMGNLVHIPRSVGMTPRSKQTVGQMQEDCNDGDDFEMLAEHSRDSRQSAVTSQLQLSCINTPGDNTPGDSLLFSFEPIFYDDPVILSPLLEDPAKAPRNEQHS